MFGEGSRKNSATAVEVIREVIVEICCCDEKMTAGVSGFGRVV